MNCWRALWRYCEERTAQIQPGVYWTSVNIWRAVAWLWWRRGFDPEPVRMGFTVDQVALVQVSVLVLLFLLPVNFPIVPYSFIHLPPTLYNAFPPNTSVFPCRCHSTIVPYSFIHIPPTLYNVFPPSTSVFPCRYHSTIAPYTFIHLPPTLYVFSDTSKEISTVSLFSSLFFYFTLFM